MLLAWTPQDAEARIDRLVVRKRVRRAPPAERPPRSSPRRRAHDGPCVVLEHLRHEETDASLRAGAANDDARGVAPTEKASPSALSDADDGAPAAREVMSRRRPTSRSDGPRRGTARHRLTRRCSSGSMSPNAASARRVGDCGAMRAITPQVEEMKPRPVLAGPGPLRGLLGGARLHRRATSDGSDAWRPAGPRTAPRQRPSTESAIAHDVRRARPTGGGSCARHARPSPPALAARAPRSTAAVPHVQRIGDGCRDQVPLTCARSHARELRHPRSCPDDPAGAGCCLESAWSRSESWRHLSANVRPARMSSASA